MQDTTDGTTWAEWIEKNADEDEGTKLAALRQRIFDEAVANDGVENITHTWLNKKLAKLGITQRIQREQVYSLEAPVTATVTIGVYATNRAEAVEKFNERLRGANSLAVTGTAAAGDPVFVSGPEDVNPNNVDPDAPTTVADTLVKLREVILLGHISGPRYCEDGANGMLGRFGLDPVPPVKNFTVTRPVQSVMATTVTAYDEASAERVAGWRWENDRTAYSMVGGEPTGDPTVAVS